MKSTFFIFSVIAAMTITARAGQSDIGRYVANPNTESVTNISPVTCVITSWIDARHIWVAATFSNSTDHVVAVLKANLLKADELTWNAFQISRGGLEVPYLGVFKKLLPPTEDDFVILKSHEVSKSQINIIQCYDFSQHGIYSIRYFAINPPYRGEELFEITSDTIELRK